MNPERPSVAIIVVNWNRCEDTLACLGSLEKITYPNYRVILVDNGSEDGSAQAVLEKFPRVQVIELSENRRFAGGNNVGLQEVLKKGDNCALLLNNDTLVEPDFLEQLASALQQDSRIGMAAPKILYSSRPDVIWFAGGVVHPAWGYVRHFGLRQRDNGRFDHPLDVSFLTGCCLLIRREVLQTAGLLDEGFFLYSEDADYCLRVAQAGYRLRYVPTSRIFHHVSSSTGGAYNLRKWKQRYVSLFRLVYKHTSPLTYPLFLLNVAWELLSLPVNAFLQTRRLPESK